MKSKRTPLSGKESHLSPSKRRAFTLFIVLFPLALLLLLEVALRLLDYGPNLSLFTTLDVGGRTYHVMNPEVKQRYFAQSSFNPSTSQELFQVPKPAGTFRIFCLGGSTMVGYPYWFNAAPSSFLRDRLRRIFPSRHIEVVNVGMTAINSFAVVDMARDLLRYEPDLFLVYDGHNEFYGGLGVASHETVGGVRWITRLYLRLIHLGSFQLLRSTIGWFTRLFGGPPPGEQTGTMMEQLARGQLVPYGSSLYAQGLSAFQENLDELAEICSAGGVPLILATQVSNLRSQPPFAPADTLRADAQFWIARSLDSLGETEAASRAYSKARDYDQLRFRASSDFNEAIRSMGNRSGLGVADAESVLAAASPGGILDSTLLFEHVHPRARGYFLMAKAYQEAMRKLNVLASRDEWRAADTLDETALWESRPLTELDEVLANRRNQILTSGWPFQPASRKVPPVAPDDHLALLAEKIVTAKLTWEYAHVAAAEFYEGRRDFQRAAREYQALINQYPNVVSAYLRLGRVLSAMGRAADAEEIYRRSLSVEETAHAYRVLGKMANNEKRFPEAITLLGKAVALASGTREEAEDRYGLALVYINSGDAKRGVEELRKLLVRHSDYSPARKLLQQLQRGAG